MQARTLPRELLCIGPAGTGKTFPILTILHCIARDYANVRILIVRQTRASLTESVMATFEDEVLPSDGAEAICLGERRDHRRSYRYPKGSRIVLGGLDKPDRIMSTSWDIVFCNEAIEISEDSQEKLGSRLNRPGSNPKFGYFLLDTNPGDPSHWLKKRIDSGRMACWETTHASNPALFDQNGWTEAWSIYKERLEQMQGTRRKRLYQGLWSAGEGQWFSRFDVDLHRTKRAEYDPGFPVHLSVDTGVHTGATLWQIIEEGGAQILSVFGDYYSYDVPAYEIGGAILNVTKELSGGRYDVGRRDPSGAARSGFGGMTISSEYIRAGLKLTPWQRYDGSPAAGLTILDSFISTEPARFRIHPRCTNTIDALSNYKRKKRGQQYVDEPEDPQHPYEELVDSLRSGLLDKYPEGRLPDLKVPRIAAGRIFK